MKIWELMSEVKKLKTPLTEQDVLSLKAGDEVTLTGVVYTARDMAHKRLCEFIENAKPLPFPLEGAVIYYVGPTPAPPGRPIGAAGPTTSSRMDKFCPLLLSKGLKATVGKGYRTKPVIDALEKHKAVHLTAIGGAGALLSKYITDAEVIAFDDLGAEAVRQLKVVDFPAVVAYDTNGNSVYK